MNEKEIIFTAQQFVEIFTGKNQNYSITGGNARAAFSSENEFRRANGFEPLPYPVCIPSRAPHQYDPKFIVKEPISIGEVHTSKSLDRQIFIRNVTFCEFINLKVSSKFEISFINCTFKAGLLIGNSKLSNLYFSNCNFHNLKLVNSEIQQFSIGQKTKIEEYFEANFSINYLEKQYLKFEINDIECKKVSLKSFPGVVIATKIKCDEIILQSESDTSIKIEDIECKILHISGKYFSENNTISQRKIDEIIFENFENYGKFSVNNVNKLIEGGKMKIVNSFLGNLSFNSIKFLDSVKIINSNIQNINITNSELKTPFEPCEDTNAEIYRQFKKVYERLGNRMEQLKFEKLEYNEYYKSINKKTNCGDFVILCTNKWSNDFGQNFLRTLGIWLILNILVLTIIQFFLGNRVFDFDKIPTAIIYFFNQAILPLNSFKDVFGIENQSYLGLLFILTKLLNVYLIFQGIRAFRKFSLDKE